MQYFIALPFKRIIQHNYKSYTWNYFKSGQKIQGRYFSKRHNNRSRHVNGVEQKSNLQAITQGLC